MKRGLIYLITISLLQSLAWGDVTVIRTFTLDNLLNRGRLEGRGIMQIHGALGRHETKVRLHGKMRKEFNQVDENITLVLLDKGVAQNMSGRKRASEEVPLSRWRSYWEERSKAKMPEAKSASRLLEAWSRTVSAREFQILNGRRCKRTIYELHFGVFNADSRSRKDYCVRTTLWLADPAAEIKKTLDEENAFLSAYREKLGGAAPEDLNRLSLAYATQLTGLDESTLSAALAKAMSYMKSIQGYLVASQTEWFLTGFRTMKPLFVVRSEVESFSLDPLPSSAFSLS